MDLTDILFSKPFIGSSGEGGSGSNVETATIEITVTDSTPTITSGEFPDWCTEANSEHIYGKTVLENVYISGASEGVTGTVIVVGVVSMETTDGVLNIVPETGYGFAVAKDLSYVGGFTNDQVTSGKLIITLIHMPKK